MQVFFQMSHQFYFGKIDQVSEVIRFSAYKFVQSNSLK